MSDGERQPWDKMAWARIVGLGLALLPMLVRMQSALAPLPYWDGDPVNREVPLIGMVPSVSLIGDLVSLLGAAVLIGASERRQARALWPVALIGIGAWACLWWAPSKGYDVRTAMAVGAWTSGAGAALGLWFAGRDERVRRLGFALIVGAVGLLAVKGMYECFVQHPATVAEFQRNKARILADNGWSPDSSMAKSFERRVMQNEATGWFGFANVYASFAAMGVAAFGTLLFGATKARSAAQEERDETATQWPVLLTGSGLLLSGAALVMAGAKGGYAAAALGLGVGAVLLWLRSERGESFRRAAWLIGPAAIAGPLLAVVARGAIGEKVGELSILFRWFYMQGAWRIFGSHPAHGVGPDGFQAAYLLAKNPLSPEDVTSPHSVLWDWMACLGVGAIAWVVWMVCTSAKIGPSAVAGADDGAHKISVPHTEIDDTRTLMRAMCLIAVASAFASIPMHLVALLPEEALGVRLGGPVIWCVLSCAVLSVTRRWNGWPVALAAGAVVLLAHSQIELTGVVVQSCGVVLAMVALAAAGCSGRSRAETPEAPAPPARTGASLAPRLLGVIGCLAAMFVLLGPTHAMRTGGRALRESYLLLEPVRTTRETLEAATKDHSPDAPDLARKLREIEPRLLREAAARLPESWPPARSASQLAMQLSLAFATEGSGTLGTAWSVRSVEYAMGVPDETLDKLLAGGTVSEQAATEAFGRLKASQAVIGALDSTRAGWVGTVCLAAAEKGVSPGARAWQEAAMPFLERAEATDPYNPFHVQRRMETLVALGRTDEARSAAKRLLVVDALQRLDRAVRGLTDRDRARAERIAAGK